MTFSSCGDVSAAQWIAVRDQHWAGIGAERDLVDSLVTEPRLDVVRVEKDRELPFYSWSHRSRHRQVGRSSALVGFNERMPEMSGIHHIAVTVSDLEVSTRFYERVLGMSPASSLDGPGLKRRLFALPGGTNLGLTQHSTPPTGPSTPFEPGLDHLGLAVRTIEDLQEWADHLTGLGIDHPGLVEAPYGTALSFKDPDGTAMEFFTPR